MSDEEPHDPSTVLELSRRKRTVALKRVLRLPSEEAAAYVSILRITLGQLKRSRLAKIGALIVSLLALTAVFADLVASDLPVVCKLHGTVYVLPNVTHPAALEGYDNGRIAEEVDAAAGDFAIYPPVRFGPSQASTHGRVDALAAPSFTNAHLLGTDAIGRDVLARLVHGTRTALTVGLMAVVAFAGIGIFLGALAGFFGGVVDAVVSRVVETLTAFPTIILVLVVQAVLPNPTMYTLLLAIGLTRWTEVARLVRAEVMLVSAQDYVQAARALGASPSRILRRHVLPNAVAPALVTATFGVASVVLIEASLDFLRIGLPASVPSWGETLSEARDHGGAWWLLVFPGAMVFVTVIALNMLGEALRDALDPRLRDAVRIAGTAQEASASRDTTMPPSSATFDESTHT